MKVYEEARKTIVLELSEEDAAQLATLFGAVTAKQVEEIARLFRELPPDFREKMRVFLRDGWAATKAYRFSRKTSA